MLQRRDSMGWAMAALLAWASASAQAELRYRLQELTYADMIANGLPGPVDYFVPSALNNQGMVVGLRQQEIFDEVREYIETAYVSKGTRVAPLAGSDAFRESHASGINDRGQIIGGYRLPDTFWQTAYLYANGQYKDLRVEDTRTWDEPAGINASGQIAGTANGKAFFFDGTRSRYLDIPGAAGSSGRALNDQGTVVGTASFSAPGGSYEERAYVYDGHGPRFLQNPLPDFGTPEMMDINNAGQMVANVFNGERQARRSFIYNAEGRFTELGSLSSLWERTVVEALNDRGWVVGHSRSDTCDVFSCDEAFLWRNGRMVSLNDLLVLSPGDHWYLSSAVDINEHGQIVGNGWHNSVYGAYLLTPVPEPAHWALLLAGLGVVGTAAARRRATGRG